MTTVNPFHPDYKAKIKIDSTKYKRPVLNQPPRNSLISIVPKTQITLTERYNQIVKSGI